MFTITYDKTGRSIEIPNEKMRFILDQSQLDELGFTMRDRWIREGYDKPNYRT